jgi:hypothetical protein
MRPSLIIALVALLGAETAGAKSVPISRASSHLFQGFVTARVPAGYKWHHRTPCLGDVWKAVMAANDDNISLVVNDVMPRNGRTIRDIASRLDGPRDFGYNLRPASIRDVEVSGHRAIEVRLVPSDGIGSFIMTVILVEVPDGYQRIELRRRWTGTEWSDRKKAREILGSLRIHGRRIELNDPELDD